MRNESGLLFMDDVSWNAGNRLAIVKSIVEFHGRQIKVEIHGEQFNVIMHLLKKR